MATIAVSVKITSEEKKRLAAIAKATRRSSHFHMREALLKHLEEAEARLDFIREAEEATRDYHETGLHMTSDNLQKWVAAGMKGEPQWDK